jgi:hypothetical protein
MAGGGGVSLNGGCTMGGRFDRFGGVAGRAPGSGCVEDDGAHPEKTNAKNSNENISFIKTSLS